MLDIGHYHDCFAPEWISVGLLVRGQFRRTKHVPTRYQHRLEVCPGVGAWFPGMGARDVLWRDGCAPLVRTQNLRIQYPQVSGFESRCRAIAEASPGSMLSSQLETKCSRNYSTVTRVWVRSASPRISISSALPPGFGTLPVALLARSRWIRVTSGIKNFSVASTFFSRVPRTAPWGQG